MTIDHRSASATLEELLRSHTTEQLLAKLAPKTADPAAPLPRATGPGAEELERRWALLPNRATAEGVLLDAASRAAAPLYSRNIENFIGTVRLPVGIAGPLRVNGTYAQGDFYVPLATTEAALVASYSRGAQIISEAGGCAAIVLHEGLSRAPGFAFNTVGEAGKFVAWAVGALPELRQIAEATTRHGRLRDMRVNLEGNHVYLIFEYTTGNAAGQNMVTIATQAICEFIAEHAAVQPTYSFVEANHSGDKKASAQSFLGGRGKSVTCECVVPAEVVERRLHTTVEMMARYWAMSAMGGVMSGTIGVQGHYANGLAAVYLACGQDVACVAESAVGATRFEVTETGALYAAVTLPNLIVGTVGGGTGLPSQRACLEVMGLAGAGHARALAEVCAGVALAGELSIIGALSAGDFARAHERLARGRVVGTSRVEEE